MAGNLARGNDLNIGQGKVLKGFTIFGLIFLLLPLIILVVFSFNESKTVTHWTGFSLKWYQAVFQDKSMWLAVKNSMIIAVVSTIFTTILGTMSAIVIAKHAFRGKQLFQNLLYVPVILPEIIFGVSLLALFMLLGFPLGVLSVIVAHITFSFPFVTMIVLAKVLNLPNSLEEASLDLGARKWQTFVKVILPNISSGIVSGALFAFTLSIDDFVITFFTAGVGASTLPLKIYSLIKFGMTPAINAVSTILILFTIIALYLSNKLQNSQRIGKKFRMSVLIGFSLIIFAGLIAPLFNQNEKQLNIYNYSSYLDEGVIRDFEKEYGIKVSLDYYNDNEELLSRLQMGVAGYDLIVPTGYMVKIMISKGLLAEINRANIPNYQYLNESMLNLPYDPNGLYSLPYSYGTTGIVYNSEKIQSEVNSWGILWDESLKGKITMLDDVKETFFAAMTFNGDSFLADTAALFNARNLLIRQKPLLKKYESNAVEDLMLSEDVWVAHAWNGQAARLSAMDSKFKFVLPAEGATFWTDNLCIPANSEHKEEAELFIDFLLRPENSAQNMTSIAYAMANDSARQLLDSAFRYNYIIFPEENQIKRLTIVEDLGEFNKALDRAWTEVKAN